MNLADSRGTTAPSPRVLWLEDNAAFARLLEQEFEPVFSMDTLASYEEFKKIPTNQLAEYEAILIDLHLLDGNLGSLAVDHIKDAGLSTPIVIISNDDSVSTKTALLRLGVDDFIGKAMTTDEMKLRIGNAIARHRTHRSQKNLSLGNLIMQPMRLLVTVAGENIELSRLEFHVLLLLLQAPAQELEIEPFKQEVWRQSIVTDGTINTLLWQLNKKLAQWEYRLSKDRERVILVHKN